MQTSHGGETTTAWCDTQASHSAGAIRTLQVRMELPLFPDESWRPMGMKAEICSRSCLVLDGFNPGKWTCARANDAHQLSDFRLLQLLPDCLLVFDTNCRNFSFGRRYLDRPIDRARA